MGMGAPAWSLGFGRPVSRAILGETFSVTVPVRLESAESLADDCLAADVFFGDDKLPSSAITATLLPGQGPERTVRISTTALINEPVVTLYVIAGCKAKVTRKFVAFADPPMIATPALAQSGSNLAGKDMASEGSAAVVASAVTSGSASASIERLPGKPGRSGRDSRVSKAPVAGSATGQAGSSAVTASSAAPRAPEKLLASKGGLTEQGASRKKPREQLSARLDPTPAAREPASRLVLDPVEADAVVAPNLSMSGQMVSVPADLDSPESRDRRAAAAALWAAMSASPEQLARDRIRMQELEQRLAKLQQDAASAREKVVSMEARVREAEDARLSNPMVMGLAGVCVLLAGALGYMFWRQRQRDAEGAWWQPAPEGEPADEAEAHSLVERSLDRTSAEFVARPPAPAEVLPPPAASEVPSPVAASATAFVGATSGRVDPPVVSATVAPAGRPSLIKSEAQEAVREITVEELIDLEQQAEFFVVLGQDDAAVELLESHVQNTAGASPLPYLKLLEIYQRLGRKAQYQQVQSDFNGRFNAYAPSWESDLLQGHALEEYPGVVERLQSLWSRPAEAMDVLQKSLTRPDESVETFDLPAYRELLFLYAVARDLSERESAERQPVDLMGQAAHQLIAGSEPMVEPHPSHEPLMATRPVKASPDVRPPSLSLDLSLDDPASGHGALVDEMPLHIDLPEIDAGLVDEAAQATERSKAAASGNDIEFEHIEIDAPQKS